MVYFRIEMGLGHSPKKKECNATNAMNLDGMSFAMAEAERMQNKHATRLLPIILGCTLVVTLSRQ